MQAKLDAIQQEIQKAQLDGWLLYMFHSRNDIALRLLELTERVRTRRCYYFIPAQGTPTKILHRIEPDALAELPGKDAPYLSHQELAEALRTTLQGAHRVAMEYSPQNMIPYVSLVDAGSVEQIRSFDIEVVSSADLVQRFEAVLTPAQIQLQDEAADRVHAIMESTFGFIREQAPVVPLTEFDVQKFIMDKFREHELITDHPPIVAFGSNSGNPHHEPSQTDPVFIQPESVVLLDMWARLDQPDAVFHDITWMGYYGTDPADRIQEVFRVVKEARQAGLDLIRRRFADRDPVAGWEVDHTVRNIISGYDLADRFIHRTGHSITTSTHGSGANMDNLESHDLRRILPGTSFSLEPGVYLPEFGIRLEYDVRVDPDHRVHIVGNREQNELIML